MTDQVIDEVFTIRTNAQGDRYLKVKGRRGWPLKMLDGETPDQTLERYENKRYERRMAASATEDTSPDFTLDDAPASTEPPESEPTTARRPDPLPRPRGAGKQRARVTSASLERMIAELLALPAIPAATVLRCQYCAAHFAKSSRQTAKELVALAEESEPLRRLLERMHEAWSTIGYASILGGYILKPVLHHLAPFEVRQSVGPFMGVPLNHRDHHHPEFMRQQQEAAARHHAAQQEATRAAAAAPAAPPAPDATA